MSQRNEELQQALAASNVALCDLAEAVQILLTACQNHKVKFGKGKLAQVARSLEVSAVVSFRNSRILYQGGGGDGKVSGDGAGDA